MCGWIKSMRSEGATFLEKYPNANHLLNIIARRARRTKCNRQNLNVGECFVGFKSSGLSEQQYRTAKKQLTKWAFAEFKTVGKLTDSGTVARLMDSSVYDINIEDDNGKATEEQRKANGKVTTNKESKNDKNEKKKTFCQLIANEYNLILGDTLPRVKLVNDSRVSAINGTIKQFKGNEKDFSDIETWKGFFNFVLDSDFLIDGANGWKADFDFLTKKNNVLKVCEGKYHNDNQ